MGSGFQFLHCEHTVDKGSCDSYDMLEDFPCCFDRLALFSSDPLIAPSNVRPMRLTDLELTSRGQTRSYAGPVSLVCSLAANYFRRYSFGLRVKFERTGRSSQATCCSPKASVLSKNDWAGTCGCCWVEGAPKAPPSSVFCDEAGRGAGMEPRILTCYWKQICDVLRNAKSL